MVWINCQVDSSYLKAGQKIAKIDSEIDEKEMERLEIAKSSEMVQEQESAATSWVYYLSINISHFTSCGRTNTGNTKEADKLQD